MAEMSGIRTFETGIVTGRALLPGPPATWTYSSLKDVETCPRRYALSRADYPELWDKHGYPRLPIPAAIKGNVVHGALEVIVKALVKAGCSSTRSARAVEVLRRLGGYTAVAEDTLHTQLSRFEGNPRISKDRRAQVTHTLTDWIPEARKHIQTYLNRMELRPTLAPTGDASAASGDGAVRYPARVRDHPEAELIADGLRFKGRVDLLSVGPGGAKITDFKTGAEDPAHRDQLRLYALLWDADSTVNPDGLAVTSLVVAYPNHDVAFPVPSRAELADLAEEVGVRIVAADSAVSTSTPRAVTGEHCATCSVRGLCEPYWTIAPRTSNVSDGTWYDLDGTVIREHGVKSWVLREARTGGEVLVRTPSPAYTFPLGVDVRLLGVRRTVDADDEDALIAGITNMSEVLYLTG